MSLNLTYKITDIWWISLVFIEELAKTKQMPTKTQLIRVFLIIAHNQDIVATVFGSPPKLYGTA